MLHIFSGLISAFLLSSRDNTPGISIPSALAELAPTGVLRAAINYGNPVLANKDPITGDLYGVSVDLAHALGKRLDIPVALIAYDAAGKVVAASKTDAWDIAFLAIDPERATEISFTAPYVLIEGTYLVPEGSPLHTIADVDRQGVRIAVGNKSAYDLYLSRHIKHATLVRAPSPAAALELFLNEKLEVVAGVKQPLLEFARQTPGMRVMEGRFMTIEQAMVTHKARELGIRYLSHFIEEMKDTGFIAQTLEKHK